MRLTKTRLALTAIALCATIGSAAQRERVNFDGNWRFAYGNAASPEKDFGCGTEYFNYFTKANSIHNIGPYTIKFVEDSSVWRSVDLPFDFVVDLAFEGKASYSHGHKCVGWQYPETSVGWYRKTFNLPESDKGKNIHLQFDGIFRDAQIWVNGILVGSEPSGYKHQDYDITPYLFFGEGADKANLVCVRSDATFEEGWFYEGAGIYRHTWIVKSNPVHVANDGTFVYADISGDFGEATVSVETEVVNDRNTTLASYSVQHSLVDAAGNVVATFGGDGSSLKPSECGKTKHSVSLKSPMLWSIETPYLYNVLTKVVVDGNVVDEYATRTGFRKIELDKDRGLFLNGKHVKLKGFNCHQDHAGVGSGIPDGLQLYRMEQLKALGANAYRASHNPMTTELLNICDSLGILVFAENRLLGINDFQMSVGLDMIRHDRNHPSVFTWSIGNEEWGLEWDARCVDIAETMAAKFRLADPTRPVAAASSSGPEILKGVDIAGYNYIVQHPIEEHRKNFPCRIAVGSEETTGCGTRGVYFNEKPELFAKKNEKDGTGSMFLNANPGGRMPSMNRFPDVDHDSTMNRIERGWKYYDERPWLLGLFYWTGFDYRGESGPLDYPATGSQFGILDYCGFPKDEAFYLKAWWKPEEPMVHILPHWNLEGHEGETISVWVYGNCDEVELKVNGKNLGRKPMPKNGHLEWEAIYQPGRVEAIGYNSGKRVATERIETASEAKQVKIEKWQSGDITVANIAVLDKKGRFVPTASLPLTVNVDGNVRILGYGNGDSAFLDQERPQDPDARTFDIKTFNGRAQVILQSPDNKFTLDVKM